MRDTILAVCAIMATIWLATIADTARRLAAEQHLMTCTVAALALHRVPTGCDIIKPRDPEA